MIRTAVAYREGPSDGREVRMSSERVTDVTTHLAFRPIIGKEAPMYEMAREAAHQAALMSPVP